MSELRKDPIVDRWVIIAKDRAARPNEYETAPRHRSDKPCPFCEGNESITTQEVAAYRDPDTQANEPGWRVRVIPNKYPALVGVPPFGGPQSPPERGTPAHQTGFQAVGIHEVIIESPKHLLSTTDLTVEQLTDVLSIYRDRMLAIKEHPAIKYAQVFKNVGPAAGASIEHAHSQLLAMPMVPTLVAEELAAAKAFQQSRSECIFCDLMRCELAEKARIVLETPSFLAFCPYAPRFPFETWLLPKHHAARFEEISPADLPDLAASLRSCIDKIGRAVGQQNYNYLLHTAPFDTGPQSHYHWHIEIFPRATTQAGFEWGTSCFINPLPPEEAAAMLRQQ